MSETLKVVCLQWKAPILLHFSIVDLWAGLANPTSICNWFRMRVAVKVICLLLQLIRQRIAQISCRSTNSTTGLNLLLQKKMMRILKFWKGKFHQSKVLWRLIWSASKRQVVMQKRTLRTMCFSRLIFVWLCREVLMDLRFKMLTRRLMNLLKLELNLTLYVS